ERALAREKLKADSEEVTADSDRQTKKSVFEQEQEKYDDIEDQIRKCVITSPQDGMVVYYVSEQSRYGSGSQQSIIAQGEPVREGQNLMRIPDLSRMLVNTKVHEAMVSRLNGTEPAHIRVDAYPDRVLNGKVTSVATIASQQDWMSA